ncbi:methyl-accepting chemotaxis protein [Actinoplanes subtropicus]|uniref:methyl-accepting chemotaxis protein n=1 Tax=Actinoplanes subtropicus TaxID=543632 RepID=UPI0004C45269|nr:methyl-accepting chemotaxis protein [Actinoplanes subtropicus]
MGILANLSTRTKLLIAVALVASAGVLIGIVAIVGMGSMRASSAAIYQQNVKSLNELSAARISSLVMRSRVYDAAVSQDPKKADSFIAKIPAEDATFDQAFGSYAKTAAAARAADVADVQAAIVKYRQIRDQQLVPAARDHDFVTFAAVRDSQTLPVFTALTTGLTNLINAETAAAGAANAASTRTATSARRNVIILLVLGLLLGIAFALYVSRSIVNQVARVAQVLDALAAGDLTRSAGITSRDEIGVMALALDNATARLRATMGAVGQSSLGLADAATGLAESSNRIAESADRTNEQANSASAAAEQVSHNVQTVAAASEEMGSSIREIATSSGDAARVAHDAVGVAKGANDVIGQLGQSSSEIGAVVNTITSIAEQTNLLALNATIEAARAGDAGKGFAVVAGEVKDLALETAKATGDISQRVQAIQANTDSAVEAILRIAEVIEQISEYATTIASAVEEQTSVTSEISRNITEAAAGSTAIAGNITGVATAVEASRGDVAATHRAAQELAAMSTQLRQEVGQFRY